MDLTSVFLAIYLSVMEYYLMLHRKEASTPGSSVISYFSLKISYCILPLHINNF